MPCLIHTLADLMFFLSLFDELIHRPWSWDIVSHVLGRVRTGPWPWSSYRCTDWLALCLGSLATWPNCPPRLFDLRCTFVSTNIGSIGYCIGCDGFSGPERGASTSWQLVIDKIYSRCLYHVHQMHSGPQSFKRLQESRLVFRGTLPRIIAQGKCKD